jgi:prepilin-type N-terminal cleavage/methylation domain-containing protein
MPVKNYAFKGMFGKIKSLKGFSLIEVLLGILILSFLMGAGVSNYRRLNARKLVENAAKKVEQAIRDTQKQASAGVKPPGWCSTFGESLEAYTIELANTLPENRYRITAICSSGDYLEESHELASDIRIRTDHLIRFEFAALGRPDNYYAVCISDNKDKFFYQIVLSRGGSVSFKQVLSC